jgi:hypothetical protein
MFTGLSCLLRLKDGPNCLVKIGYLPDQRLKINAALVPPNPKELDSAYSTEALRALLGT